MTNIIKELEKRIEERRKETKNPCKSYATEEAAEKATLEMATKAAELYSWSYISGGAKVVTPAKYVVFYIESWGRWVGAIDMTGLMLHHDFAGGYVGTIADKGFFTF